jgi:hypothetical protein
VLVAGLACAPRKKLVQWGWDEPDAAYLRAHLAVMERSPFDGCVFGVRHGHEGAGGSFTWELWGRRRFEPRELASSLADLQALRPRRFKENFLRINVTPGDIDWFEDFTPVLANARLAAELARAGRARGVLLDVEQYKGPLFEYAAQKGAANRSWDDLARQVRFRGRQTMAALQRGYPGLTLFLTFGYTLPWVLSESGKKPLAETPYGLLAPFLDGLLEAAEGRTRLVDGFELSYGYRHPRSFTDARTLFTYGVRPIVGAPRKYRARCQLAFGLWLDYDWRRQGWSTTDLSRNYFTPEGFAASLANALEHSDRYVWIYNETPRWWNPTAGQRVPGPYSTAATTARWSAR